MFSDGISDDVSDWGSDFDEDVEDDKVIYTILTHFLLLNIKSFFVSKSLVQHNSRDKNKERLTL